MTITRRGILMCFLVLLSMAGAALLGGTPIEAMFGRYLQAAWIWLATLVGLAWALVSRIPDSVGVILGLLFWAWMVWSIGRGIWVWWRAREQDASTRQRMVLMRLDHLEVRLDRLARAVQGPDADTLHDLDDDEEGKGGFTMAQLYPQITGDRQVIREMVRREVLQHGEVGATRSDLAADLIESGKARGTVEECAALLDPLLEELVTGLRVKRAGDRFVALSGTASLPMSATIYTRKGADQQA